jgi:hypothetical protein
MAEVVLRVDVGSVKVNKFRIYILGIVPDESVLFVAFVQLEMLLE